MLPLFCLLLYSSKWWKAFVTDRCVNVISAANIHVKRIAEGHMRNTQKYVEGRDAVAKDRCGVFSWEFCAWSLYKLTTIYLEQDQ